MSVSIHTTAHFVSCGPDGSFLLPDIVHSDRAATDKLPAATMAVVTAGSSSICFTLPLGARMEIEPHAAGLTNADRVVMLSEALNAIDYRLKNFTGCEDACDIHEDCMRAIDQARKAMV